MPEAPTGEYREYAAKVHAGRLGVMYQENLVNSDPATIHFGPTYFAKTSKDVRLRISTIMIDPQPVFKPPTIPTYLFIAQNLQGNILGHREICIRDRGEDLETFGEINTATPGEGVAKPLELATLDFLQRIATQKGESILWSVENLNLKNLQEIKRTMGKPDEAQNRELLEKLNQEQIRWQALYGPRGKLGFDNKTSQTVSPDPNIESFDLETIDSFLLAGQEIDQGDRKIVIPVTARMIVGNRNAVQAAKLTDYNEELLPAIKAIIPQQFR